MDDYSPDDYSKKQRCLPYMKVLKDEDKKPFFGNGKLKCSDGFVKEKVVKDYNKRNGIEDPRSKQYTVESLNMTMPKRKKNNRPREMAPAVDQEEQGATAAAATPPATASIATAAEESPDMYMTEENEDNQEDKEEEDNNSGSTESEGEIEVEKEG